MNAFLVLEFSCSLFHCLLFMILDEVTGKDGLDHPENQKKNKNTSTTPRCLKHISTPPSTIDHDVTSWVYSISV